MKKVLVCFISFLLVGVSTLTAATDAHITGHVLDATTREHLSFINVQVKGTSLGSVTDETGHYYLKNLPLGKQTVVFSAMGYDTREVAITVVKDTTIELKVELEESSYLLENVVAIRVSMAKAIDDAEEPWSCQFGTKFIIF